MNKSSFEEILKDEGRLVYSNVGMSMQPLIRQGRDLLIIERTAGRLKKYDVPLYKRDNGQYVMQYHPDFAGKVKEIRGSGTDARIVISFTAYGSKEFALAIAPIVKLED